MHHSDVKATAKRHFTATKITGSCINRHLNVVLSTTKYYCIAIFAVGLTIYQFADFIGQHRPIADISILAFKVSIKTVF